MWQRIQTLYLLLASVLAAVVCFHGYKAGYAVLSGIALAAQVLAVFMFKGRTLQMRLSVLAALILAGLQVWMAVDYFSASRAAGADITLVFPVAAAIFDLLAVRGILADEFLVRSAGRLRASKKKK